MIGFNVPPYIGTEMKYIEEAGEENRNGKSAADHLLYPCHRDGSTAGGY